MTYTFKLSRRLAVSRRLAYLASAILLSGCADDAMAPGSEQPTRVDGIPIRIVPRAVTAEINQPIRFRGEHHGRRGEPMPIPLAWEVSGGTIDERGVFRASAAGVYKVVGRGRGRNKSDTSVVVVVPSQPDLVKIEVTPDTTTLGPAGTYAFAATGILSDSSRVAVGVSWQASGGQIDAGGLYTAGPDAGSYRVVATNTAGTLADTSTVAIVAPPPPPSVPTLTSVVLKPGAITLGSGKSQQFTAYGWNSLGDSVEVAATYAATGGTISANGLYTAGATAGSFRVVAQSEGVADTAVVTLTTSTSGSTGIPFGPYALLNSTSNPRPFSMGMQGTTPSAVLDLLAQARDAGVTLMLQMTGGSHDRFMSTIDGVYQFDMAKWKAVMDEYNTGTIRQAVADAVAEGRVVGNSVMDEPHVKGGGGDGNTWGPAGTMTKVRVDSMCAYVKRIFPTLPVGVVHRHDVFEPTKDYRTCEFIVDQYSVVAGDVNAFRDAALAFANRSNITIAFSLNILNGGTKDLDGTWDCKDQGGYPGTFSPNCQMTAAQLKSFGTTLGPAGCAMTMWKWRSDFASRSDNQTAFAAIANTLSGAPRSSCGR